eukprot:g1783.t1
MQNPSAISEIAFSGDGCHILMGARNLAVRVWSVRSGGVDLVAPPLAGSNDDGGYHAGHLSCDTLQHPTRGLLMAAGGVTGGVLVWNSCCEPVSVNEETAVGGPRPTADLRNNGHEYGIPVTHLAAYPDGSFFVSADSTTLKFWSAQDFTCKRTIRSTFEVEILMVSAGGKFVFVVGVNGGVNGGSRRKASKSRAVVAVWNGRKRGTIYPGYGGERDPMRLLIGHGRPIQSLYTPENPDALVTSALDAMVKIWDVPTGVCTKTIWSKGGMKSPLSYAALVNRGAWLLTSCEDGSLQVWGVDTGKCLVTLVNTTGIAPPTTTTSSLPLRTARLAVSRCGRLAAFAVGRRIKVLDFDRLADRSAAAGPPGQPGAYLRHALRFVTSPAT